LAPAGLEILVDSPITSLNMFSMKCTAAKQAIAPRIAKKMIDLNVPSRNLCALWSKDMRTSVVSVYSVRLVDSILLRHYIPV
jgi:hypothetical protein